MLFTVEADHAKSAQQGLFSKQGLNILAKDRHSSPNEKFFMFGWLGIKFSMLKQKNMKILTI